ncbi:NPCBM/NEW2 domain-containing protein [Thalassoroseus pseudoceratinae]|uniref:NPCBM/NEW2 domain-containing protein n=1 Tax=Thalassoroseus pseudoceratinae TaxID=2713176 RepID=UPI00141F4AC0|nr:NPCBM/NEW2 domain-containing protein [Thalassoroseus pseudoceratinae]
MIPLIAATILSLGVSAAPVEVTLLSGESFEGVLQSLDESNIVIDVSGQEKTVKLKGVMTVRPKTDMPESVSMPEELAIRLTDGSSFSASNFLTTGQQATVETSSLGTLELKLPSVSTVRFGALDSKVGPAWQDLRTRDPDRDLLIIRKGDKLDFVQGVVSEVNDDKVKFLLGSREVPLPRERVFGIVYANRDVPKTAAVCDVILTSDAKFQVQSLVSNDGKLNGKLLGGSEFSISMESIKTLDFSLGKIRYLSDMEPRKTEHTPFWDLEYKVLRNRNFQGDPLKLGDQVYERGLWIHSQTRLTYRIGGDFTRFKAVMGIDEAVASNGLGNVEVIISGDGKELLKQVVTGTDDPVAVDLDVSDVINLEIFVGFNEKAGNFDLSDHLDLAEARVIK